jgi:hypothetical protein
MSGRLVPRTLLGAGYLPAVEIGHRRVLQMRAHGRRAAEQTHFPHEPERGPANIDGLLAGARSTRVTPWLCGSPRTISSDGRSIVP